jgi:filamentous hemagglutinin
MVLLDRDDRLLEVEELHTYHVGTLGTWVHNADCCPRIGPFKGSTTESIDRINSFLKNTVNTSEGGVKNATKPAGKSRISDWQDLIVNAVVRPAGTDRWLAIFPDRSKAVLRPSTTGPKTIEFQHPDGDKIVEVRYDTE